MAARGSGKSKLTDEVVDKICSRIEQGVPIKLACADAGIASRKTYYRWLEQGKNAKSGRYRDFYDRIQASQEIAEMRLAQQMRAHCTDPKNGWRATAWMLERRFPDNWKQRTEVDNRVSGQTELSVTAPIKLQLDGKSIDELEAMSGARLDDLGLPTDDPMYGAGPDDFDGDDDGK